ncbi:hypothetical protein F5879DRAFT_1026797 [Lentinula edodes]|nr:hypothetical protein F5879DRAFT_1026797 [Lentinula edodes]
MYHQQVTNPFLTKGLPYVLKKKPVTDFSPYASIHIVAGSMPTPIEVIHFRIYADAQTRTLKGSGTAEAHFEQMEEEDPSNYLGSSVSRNHDRNPIGRNQWGPTAPLTEELRAEIEGLFYHNITQSKRIMAELSRKGYKIGRTKLFSYLVQMRAEKRIGTSRNPLISDAEQTQAVLAAMDDDPNSTCGPRRIKESLGHQGIHISRDKVTQVMQDHAPEGFQQRAPGTKVIHQTQLHSNGPDDNWSMDGHDKLAKAGFEIYGIRDKFSGKFLYYVVLPSNRYAAVIGVVLLKCIKKYGKIPVQGSTDRGSEVRDAFSIHSTLRQVFTPDLIEELIPTWNFLPSYRNITIERSWRPVFEKWGVNVLSFYNAGRYGGDFRQGDDLHQQTSNWIWYPLVQRELDTFCLEQNSHCVRKQKDKLLPSGGSADDFYFFPEKYGGQNCGIVVDMKIVDQLLDDAVEGQGRMRYVDEEFESLADAAYVAIGAPSIDLHSAWIVFRHMIAQLS